MFKDEKVKNAVMIGTLCSVSYLAVYILRNILSVVTPYMTKEGVVTNEFIGSVSSLYFIFYAIGQLINGAIGDKIKARYMISFGLMCAAICNVTLPHLLHTPMLAKIIYAFTGFFLSMIYGPMTKVVAENTEPIYATRCSLGYTFASFFGSPAAGILASLFVWRSVFKISSVMLFIMGLVCFFVFLLFEKKGMVKYNQFDRKKEDKKGIKVLIEHRIIKFTLISFLTGIVRTTVVFWLPQYFADYLNFPENISSGIFSAATLAISFTTFVAIFMYERLHHNMDLTILIAFCSSALCFLIVYFVKVPFVNIVFIILAIMSSNAAATMLWSRYCPSLRDTGMVSGATGFLDCISYLAAALSTTLFANAVSAIGWGNLILIWFALMIAGIVVALPYKKRA